MRTIDEVAKHLLEEGSKESVGEGGSYAQFMAGYKAGLKYVGQALPCSMELGELAHLLADLADECLEYGKRYAMNILMGNPSLASYWQGFLAGVVYSRMQVEEVMEW